LGEFSPVTLLATGTSKHRDIVVFLPLVITIKNKRLFYQFLSALGATFYFSRQPAKADGQPDCQLRYLFDLFQELGTIL
jgi:hypothetical protein